MLQNFTKSLPVLVKEAMQFIGALNFDAMSVTVSVTVHQGAVP